MIHLENMKERQEGKLRDQHTTDVSWRPQRQVCHREGEKQQRGRRVLRNIATNRTSQHGLIDETQAPRLQGKQGRHF